MPANNPAPLRVDAAGETAEMPSFVDVWVRELLDVGDTSGDNEGSLLVEREGLSNNFVRFRRDGGGGYEFGVGSAGVNLASWNVWGPDGSNIALGAWRADNGPPGTVFSNGAGISTVDGIGSEAGIEFDNATNNARIYGGNLQIATGSVEVATDMTVHGDLFVNGTQFIVNTETLEVEDNLILINKGEVGPGVTAGLAGLEVDRGSADNYLFAFEEVRQAFTVGLAGDTQAVATREDSPTSGGVAVWDNTASRFVTTSTDLNALVDMTELTAAALASQDFFPFYSVSNEEPRAFTPSADVRAILNAADAAAARAELELDSIYGRLSESNEWIGALNSFANVAAGASSIPDGSRALVKGGSAPGTPAADEVRAGDGVLRAGRRVTAPLINLSGTASDSRTSIDVLDVSGASVVSCSNNPTIERMSEPAGAGNQLVFVRFTTGGTIKHDQSSGVGRPILCPDNVDLVLTARSAYLAWYTGGSWIILLAT